MRARGRHPSIIVVSEGTYPRDGERVFSRLGDALITPRLGGVCHRIAALIEDAMKLETRATILGHIQRGGTPTAFDRWLATRYGAAALRLALDEGFGRMVAYRCDEVTDVSLEEALSEQRRVDLNGDAMRSAREMGISFGD